MTELSPPLHHSTSKPHLSPGLFRFPECSQASRLSRSQGSGCNQAGKYQSRFVTCASSTCPQYWLDSYDIIRYPNGKGAAESNTLVLIHDAFQPVSYWNGFMPSPQYQNYALDKHIYQIFSDDVSFHMNTAQSCPDVLKHSAGKSQERDGSSQNRM